MGHGSGDFFSVSNGYWSLSEIKRISLLPLSPFLTPRFELSFCNLCRVLKEEAVCPCI
jgi:hypothetical protein